MRLCKQLNDIMLKPKVCILRSAGTNCDQETGAAFKLAGAEVESVHINSLVSGKRSLDDFQILALSGGFSYGDDIASGKIFANELRFKLGDALHKFISQGKLIIGICNGFQILVKAGLLPGGNSFRQTVTLSLNDSAKFEDRWVYLKPAQSCCIWTKGLEDTIYLPVAHGEGKFIPQDKQVLETLVNKKQIVFQYVDKNNNLCAYPDNPNGSVENIAGICDESGRIFGLMPHPERHIQGTHHPRWTRLGLKEEGEGLIIFKNAVDFLKNT